MGIKKLTAYNEDVQRYIERSNKQSKIAIIKELKKSAFQKGINFNQLFPNNTKRYKVLDEVIYMLSGGGICKIESVKLAKNVGCSVRTVEDAVRNIKKLSDIIVGGLADGKNKYIFVYKKHENFMQIMANVFYLDVEQNVEQNVEQKPPEDTDVSTFEGGNSTSNSNNYNIFKQEKDNIRESIESDAKQSETIDQYTDNHYQKLLFQYIKDNVKNKRIQEVASTIVLRAGSNCNEKWFFMACRIIDRLEILLERNVTIDSIPALFDKMYHDRITFKDYYRQKKIVFPEAKQDNADILRYNWLK